MYFREATITATILFVALFITTQQPPSSVGPSQGIQPNAKAAVTPPVAKTASDDEKTAQASFVGRQVCKQCHQENYSLHAGHGHAQTFHILSESPLKAKLQGQSFDAGADFGLYQYSVAPSGVSVACTGIDDDDVLNLQYALGSGVQALTFLTLRTDSNDATYGIEHRGTLYKDGRIDVTTGHADHPPTTTEERYGEIVRGEPLQRCVHCHSTAGQVRNGTIEGLIANVNCEKCHGPGSSHVEQARLSDRPPPYSIGKSTWDAESELQLCGDCHRMPRNVSDEEFRDYPDLLVRFQPIGMLRSECYLQSDGAMKCTTCHNPHQPIRQVDTQQHEQNCIKCHNERPADDSTVHTVCPVSAESGCIECHMPPMELDHGLIFHDHWIRVRD